VSIVFKYPKEHKKVIILRDGAKVFLRPELSTDTNMLWEMFSTLSKESLRFLVGPFTRERIQGWTNNINYDRVLPIVGLAEEEGKTRIVASATLTFFEAPADKHKAELGITVHDDYQNKGLGTALTGHMVEIAKKRGLRKVSLRVLTENEKAIHMYEKCGFKIEARLREEHFVNEKYYDDYIMSLSL